jgi:hypothetical protein
MPLRNKINQLTQRANIGTISARKPALSVYIVEATWLDSNRDFHVVTTGEHGEA